MVLGKTRVWLFELLTASFGKDESNDAMMRVLSVFMMMLIMMMILMMVMTVVLHLQIDRLGSRPTHSKQLSIWNLDKGTSHHRWFGFHGLIGYSNKWIMDASKPYHSLSYLTKTKLPCYMQLPMTMDDHNG